ncbi:MAG TPA: A/G-specific adenine glycosylase [Rhodospirillales bacterium]|nr:A/G-specific adenine glycosylase [Rhodospirillales bacterium]
MLDVGYCPLLEPIVPLSPARLRRSLLDWYDGARRDLNWRAKPGERADPYGVWLSEIMLQQTTVATVSGYWQAFRARWPTVQALAAADVNDVLHAWQGLGYYARARNLHACAGAVIARHGGRFPDDEATLRALPGIGTYTAAAIASIAFDRPALPIDGNVVRVLARLHAMATPMPAARAAVASRAQALIATDRPGDLAQALMDLGATVCTPRRPRCPVCPWREGCAARAAGAPEEYPRPAPRSDKPQRQGVVFWAERPDGAVLVRRRPPRGLLGGMTEFPSTPWRNSAWSAEEAAALLPIAGRWQPLPGDVGHTFTHFQLRLRVLCGDCDSVAAAAAVAAAGGDGWWCAPDDFPGLALPTLMKKVVRLVAATKAAPPLPLQES